MLQHSSLYRQLSTTQAINYGEGSDNGQFRYPWSIVWKQQQHQQDLIVSDSGNNRLQWFDRLTLQHLTSYKKLDQRTELGQFNEPLGLCLQPITNNLVVSDSFNHRVQVFSLDDVVLHPLFAIGRKPIPDANGNVEDSQKEGKFYFPQGVCCSPNGGIFIVDSGNHRVQSFDAGGRFLSTFGSHGDGHQEFSSPTDVCLVHPHFSSSSLASSLLCVADYFNDRVSVWNYNGPSSSSPPQRLFNFKVAGGARGLCVDLKGYLHVACGYPSHVISIYDFRMVRSTNPCTISTDNSNIKREPALIQALGKDGGRDGRGSGPGEFFCPTGMCLDNSNTLIVVDCCNHRLQFFEECQY